MTNGQTLTQTFGSKEQLSAVRLYIEMNRKDTPGPFTLITSFPRKVFTDDDYDTPLDVLGKNKKQNKSSIEFLLIKKKIKKITQRTFLLARAWTITLSFCWLIFVYANTIDRNDQSSIGFKKNHLKFHFQDWYRQLL